MGCSPSRSTIQRGASTPWTQYRSHRNTQVYSPPYGSWNPPDAANSVNNALPPPYSEAVPQGHVSLSHRYDTEDAATDWRAESPAESLTERLASLQATDTDRQAEDCTEQVPTARRRRQQRRLGGTRSAPDISTPSNSSSLRRRGRVSPFPDQTEQPTLDHAWPNRQHSRSSPPRSITSALIFAPHFPSESRSMSPIRPPEAVRAERLRRKRMRRRSTPQRLDFSQCRGARHCSIGTTCTLSRQSIVERNRSVPEFVPFDISFTPTTFQFGTPVRQRSTSAPLPVPVTSFQRTADRDQLQEEFPCNTTPFHPSQTATAKTAESEGLECPTAPTLNQLSRSCHQRPTRVSENPFQTPNFSRSKLPPIKDLTRRSNNDVKKKLQYTRLVQLGQQKSGDLLPENTAKA